MQKLLNAVCLLLISSRLFAQTFTGAGGVISHNPDTVYNHNYSVGDTGVPDPQHKLINQLAFSVPLDSSNLPIVVINTNNQTIPNEPKIICSMGIIYNGPGKMNKITDPFNNYNGKIAIEIRGSSSQMFPKKSYGFETRANSGAKLNTVLLGMPAEHDWILSAPYTDKTLLRNVLAYKLYKDFGRYAPGTKYCELVINGQNKGVYVLTERIKRDSQRVNISKLNVWENAGDSLTGGYIIKIDKPTGNGGSAGWTSPFPPEIHPFGQTIFFQYEYPDADSITTQQKNYIRQYVDSFETVLAGTNFADPVNGYVKYCNPSSFIDYFILNEISKNIDGYRLSTYFYKDRFSKGGKIKIGPPWDYDLAWLNANYCSGEFPTGWSYQYGNYCNDDEWQVPFWWSRFMLDPNFTSQLKCRWLQLRSSVLDNAVINSYIDSTTNYLNAGMKRNFIIWPIIGKYVWPNPYPIPASYAEEITRFKKWVADRMAWLDLNMPGTCNVNIEDEASKKYFSLFPNPTTGKFTILNTNEDIEKVEVYDLVGKKIISLSAKSHSIALDLSAQQNGMYLLKASCGESTALYKIIKAD